VTRGGVTAASRINGQDLGARVCYREGIEWTVHKGQPVSPDDERLGFRRTGGLGDFNEKRCRCDCEKTLRYRWSWARYAESARWAVSKQSQQKAERQTTTRQPLLVLQMILSFWKKASNEGDAPFLIGNRTETDSATPLAGSALFTGSDSGCSCATLGFEMGIPRLEPDSIDCPL
jgi:hypothetical protein